MPNRDDKLPIMLYHLTSYEVCPSGRSQFERAVPRWEFELFWQSWKDEFETTTQESLEQVTCSKPVWQHQIGFQMFADCALLLSRAREGETTPRRSNLSDKKKRWATEGRGIVELPRWVAFPVCAVLVGRRCVKQFPHLSGFWR